MILLQNQLYDSLRPRSPAKGRPLARDKDATSAQSGGRANELSRSQVATRLINDRATNYERASRASRESLRVVVAAVVFRELCVSVRARDNLPSSRRERTTATSAQKVARTNLPRPPHYACWRTGLGPADCTIQAVRFKRPEVVFWAARARQRARTQMSCAISACLPMLM